ncbi:MAG: deaminase [Rhodoferax sp. RIFCSPLOWO2_12_FULL_60_11]|nr:MAG: deaminase [Rhodoferax sp. RIFCSPLOWO2_12_FULL_60_11]
MAELTMTAFLTLDGVMQAPGGPNEDTSGNFVHGGWLVPYADADMGQFMVEVLARADAFLLGRGTYEIFAAHWPRVTDPADSIATALNGRPKYVASKTLESADWQGSTVIRDVVGEVARLKQHYPREIQVHGSPGLAQTLLANDLVDVYRLLHFPLVLGQGKRLFGAGTVPAALKLAATQTTGAGVVISTYQRAGRPAYGSFEVDEQPRFWD